MPQQLAALQPSVSMSSCAPFGLYMQNGRVECALCHMESVDGMEEHKFEGIGTRSVCPICHCSLHLDIAGQKNAGIMIWAPEFSQAEVNSLVSIIFAAVFLRNTVPEGTLATMMNVYRTLESRAQRVEEFFGGKNGMFNARDPLFLAQQIQHARAALHSQKLSSTEFGERLDGLRFLAVPSAFKKYIRGVAHVLTKRHPIEEWASLVPDFTPEQESSANTWSIEDPESSDPLLDGPAEPNFL